MTVAGVDKLTAELQSFCTQYKLTKFEAEDIVELLSDGEDIGWIVEQLKSENEALDTGQLTSLLTDISSLVAPSATEEAEEVEAVEELEEELPAAEEELALDLSQVDLSELAEMALPPGMELPQGFDMKKVEELLQSPQGEVLADFSLFCQEKGLEDLGATMTDPEKIQELNKEWMQTPRAAFNGKTPAEVMQDKQMMIPMKVETYRREEPRIGRNDPCPCGSGKKYKKCCGRGK